MTGNRQRVEAAARALASEAAPETGHEHWDAHPEWLQAKFRRRAALALAAADMADVPCAASSPFAQAWQEGRESLGADLLRTPDENSHRPATPNPAPVQETLDLGLEPGAAAVTARPAPAAAAAVPKDESCDGYCRGSVCSYCGCCLHTVDPGSCRTAAAPAGMRCPDGGCGCEGTAG